MHIRRDDQPPQPSFQALRQGGIRMVEHGGRVKQYLENENRDDRRAERRYGRAFDRRRNQDLDRMKARSGGHIEIEVGVVHPVQAPQSRHRMEHDVLKVDGEIKQRDPGGNRCPARQGEGVEQAPSASCRRHGNGNGGTGGEDPYESSIDQQKAEVVRPAREPPERPLAARSERLP